MRMIPLVSGRRKDWRDLRRRSEWAVVAGLLTALCLCCTA